MRHASEEKEKQHIWKTAEGDGDVCGPGVQLHLGPAPSSRPFCSDHLAVLLLRFNITQRAIARCPSYGKCSKAVALILITMAIHDGREAGHRDRKGRT